MVDVAMVSTPEVSTDNNQISVAAPGTNKKPSAIK